MGDTAPRRRGREASGVRGALASVGLRFLEIGGFSVVGLLAVLWFATGEGAVAAKLPALLERATGIDRAEATGLVGVAIALVAMALVKAVISHVLARRAYARMSALLAAARRGTVSGFEVSARNAPQGRFVAKLRKLALDGTRLRAGLDACDTIIMLANRQHEIFYVNPRLVSLFEAHRERFVEQFPDIAFPEVAGADIRRFHAGLDGETAEDGRHAGQIVAAGRRLAVAITPIHDAEGGWLGAVAHWKGITHEVEIEIDGMEDMISTGELDLTMNVSASTGVYPLFHHARSKPRSRAGHPSGARGGTGRAVAAGLKGQGPPLWSPCASGPAPHLTVSCDDDVRPWPDRVRRRRASAHWAEAARRSPCGR